MGVHKYDSVNNGRWSMVYTAAAVRHRDRSATRYICIPWVAVWYILTFICSNREYFIRPRNTIIIKKPAGFKLNLRRSSSAWPVTRDNRFHFNRGTSSCLQTKFPFQEVGWIGGNNPDDGLPRFFGLTSKNLLRLAWIGGLENKSQLAGFDFKYILQYILTLTLETSD